MENRIFINGDEYDVPETVKPLTEDGIYAVPQDLIDYAEPSKEKNDDFKWFNFRHLTKKGLDDESMKKLKESIQSDGLMNPVICRWYLKGNKLRLQLVEGERRTRCIRSLLENNEDCFNRSTNESAPAEEILSTIPCRIVAGDDKESFRIAFMVQDNTVDWGESAKTRVIIKLRQAGCSDDEILELTKKSIPWLREEDHLSRLDEKTFAYYDEGKINRSVALRLCKVVDISERHKLLEEAYALAKEEYAVVLSIAEEEVISAEDKEELAEAELALAESIEDEELVVEAKEKVQKARKKSKEKKDTKKKIEKKGAQVKTKQLVKADEKVTKKDEEKASVVVKPLTPGKIKKQWDDLKELIENNGMVDNKELFPVETLQVAACVYESIFKNNEDIIKVLKKLKHKITLASMKKVEVA